MHRPSPAALWFACATWCALGASRASAAEGAASSWAIIPKSVTASSSAEGTSAEAAIKGDRFSCSPGHFWKGVTDDLTWSWQADFGVPTEVGAILQVLGDEEHHFAAQPLDCIWQASDDGETWRDLESTKQLAERRMYRIHRLPTTERARYFRLLINSASGQAPAIREVEFYADPQQSIEFPDWVLSVSSYERPDISTCHRYLNLARKCEGYSKLLAQYLWHADISLALVTAEPRPVCVFYTGNHRDWCEIDPRTWRGTLELLNDGSTPLWAACGGAQGFGLLAEYGCEVEWDCPNCRDPNHPKSPIYGHIGLLDSKVETPCGIYTNNIYELGPTTVRIVKEDPVFAGLPEEFPIPEYHCGQIEFLPKGWELLVTKGTGGKTWMQCMRKTGTCIYAAQFHIELQGTPENSRRIMSQYLAYAKAWRAEHLAAPAKKSGAEEGAVTPVVGMASTGN